MLWCLLHLASVVRMSGPDQLRPSFQKAAPSPLLDCRLLNRFILLDEPSPGVCDLLRWFRPDLSFIVKPSE